MHDDSCYQEVKELCCGIEESEGHTHDASCYEKKLVCGKEVHIHSVDCYETDSVSYNGDEDSLQDVSVDNYVPELDPLNMDAMLNGHTDAYYYHAKDGEEIPADSAEITDWALVKEDTELASTDLVKLFFAYTIPAGSLNESNPAARYRLPENIHLTDQQIKSINKNENGLAAGCDKSSAEYKNYLGAEAIEGIREPDEQLRDGAEEYISAVVRAEKTGDGGQELVFTFAPYSIEKNQNTCDGDGNILSAGAGLIRAFREARRFE